MFVGMLARTGALQRVRVRRGDHGRKPGAPGAMRARQPQNPLARRAHANWACSPLTLAAAGPPLPHRPPGPSPAPLRPPRAPPSRTCARLLRPASGAPVPVLPPNSYVCYPTLFPMQTDQAIHVLGQQERQARRAGPGRARRARRARRAAVAQRVPPPPRHAALIAAGPAPCPVCRLRVAVPRPRAPRRATLRRAARRPCRRRVPLVCAHVERRARRARQAPGRGARGPQRGRAPVRASRRAGSGGGAAPVLGRAAVRPPRAVPPFPRLARACRRRRVAAWGPAVRPITLYIPRARRRKRACRCSHSWAAGRRTCTLDRAYAVIRFSPGAARVRGLG
jgi:hypothetical protein